MSTDQEIKSMCWYDQECVNEINRFTDTYVKDKSVADHLLKLKELFNQCEKGCTLLDIGTGSAMVVELCGDFKFYGADLPHILYGCAMRNQPGYFYKSCDIIEDELAWIREFDIILLNGVIDVMYNGLGILRRVLTYSNRYVIIHRQEISKERDSRSVINNSYNSKTYHSIINRNDFDQLIEEMGFEIVKEVQLNFGNWEDGGRSFLLKNKSYQDPKYNSNSIKQLKNRIQIIGLGTNYLKLVIGAGDLVYDSSWICTNQEEFDVERESDWKFYFDEVRATHLLAEHVWEHLRQPDLVNGLAFNYLKVGGRLRIAVPDGFHPSKDYINHVKPGGIGAGADDHKYLWNYKTLRDSLEKAGFCVILVEYWDELGNFNTPVTWSFKDGYIKRSFREDDRNKDGQPHYTSLIVDAFKL